MFGSLGEITGGANPNFSSSSAYTAISSTTDGVISPIMLALFNGFFGLLYTVLPYAIGILVFYVGYHWARRALAGR